jgi:O-antigen ligase
MAISKDKIVKYIDITIVFFLCMGFITSQFSIATSSIGIGTSFALTIIRLIMDKNVYYGDRNLIYLFLFFILCQAVSSAFCANPSESFIHAAKKIVIYIIFFGCIFFIESREQLQKILRALFLFTALVSVVELIRFYSDYKPGTLLSEYRLDYYGYPITNGEIKMLILLIMIPLFMARDYIINKWLLALCSLPLLATFYLTNARNAVLGLVTGLVIIGLLKNKYFLIAIIVIVAAFLLFAPLPFKERILSIADLNHPSNKSRIIMWETGVKMINDNIIFGIGDTDVNKIYRQYKKPEFHGEGSHLHNNLLQILLNFGILGAAAWVILMIYIFIRQIKIYFKTRSDDFLSLITVSSIVSMAAFQVSGLTEWNFGDAEFAAIMWFSLSLAFLAEKFYKANKAANA